MKYDAINLMIPTYKRPGRAKQLLDSARRHAQNESTLRVTLCINKYDDVSHRFVDKYEWGRLDYHVIEEQTEQPNLALYYNMMYEQTRFNESGTLVTMIGDDMEFLTRPWDEIILRHANERDGEIVLWCNDQLAGRDSTACINLFTTRKMVETSGAPFMCPLWHADMIDVVWWYVGRYTSTLVYLDDVILRHNHNTRMPRELWDETFKRINPVQLSCRTKENQRRARQYATVVAGDIIMKGVGQWNKL